MMEILGGLVLLIVAVVLVRLGRSRSEGGIAAGIRKWRAQGAVAVLATTCVGLGLALVVKGAASIFF
ncbi:MAG TPA: hypothetical protein VKY54_07535 [Kiloniellales bacterium]|jgi:hypothetical protein|nr:hypothetical protein [Kiloniellales bacterium]